MNETRQAKKNNWSNLSKKQDFPADIKLDLFKNV